MQLCLVKYRCWGLIFVECGHGWERGVQRSCMWAGGGSVRMLISNRHPPPPTALQKTFLFFPPYFPHSTNGSPLFSPQKSCGIKHLLVYIYIYLIHIRIFCYHNKERKRKRMDFMILCWFMLFFSSWLTTFESVQSTHILVYKRSNSGGKQEQREEGSSQKPDHRQCAAVCYPGSPSNTLFLFFFYFKMFFYTLKKQTKNTGRNVIHLDLGNYRESCRITFSRMQKKRKNNLIHHFCFVYFFLSVRKHD